MRCLCEILLTLISQFRGGPVGVNTLAAAVGEAPATIEEVYEPHLMRAGLLSRTPRGRMATDAAWAHLGLKAPNENSMVNHSSQPTFFDKTLPASIIESLL